MRASILLAAVIAVSATAAAAQNSQSPQTYPMPPPPPPVISTPGSNDAPARIDATDRSPRYMQYGASIGVPRDQMPITPGAPPCSDSAGLFRLPR